MAAAAFSLVTLAISNAVAIKRAATRVFLVPGGPWIEETRRDSAQTIAWRYDSLAVALKFFLFKEDDNKDLRPVTISMASNRCVASNSSFSSPTPTNHRIKATGTVGRHFQNVAP